MPNAGFYATKPWRTIRARALKRDRWQCVLCHANLWKVGSRVDHILPRRDFPGLALNLANLRSLCPTCDNQQQQARHERQHAPRFERVDSSGFTDAWRAESEDKKR